MKILDTQRPALLSNAEVQAHLDDLNSIYEADERTDKIPDNLKEILRDVNSYLQIPSQPTSNKQPGDSSKHANFSPDKFPVLTQILKKPPYRLTPSEVLGVFNHVPKTAVDMNMIIEEAEIRYRKNTERVIEEMLGIVRMVLIEGVTDEALLKPKQTTNGVAGHAATNGD